ncbi:MAG: M28 family peptidase [Gemmataceae bacterium]
MDRRIIFAIAAVAAAVSLTAAVWKPWSSRSLGPFEPEDPPMTKKEGFASGRDPLAGVKEVAFDQERFLKYVKQLCDIGPRISGTEGMRKQQDVIIKHFESLGGKVTKQSFEEKQRSRRDKTPMMNIIVSWYPDKARRVILCCHYDTRPIADQESERRNWNRPFLSANDGTSGVAMMMELAHSMKSINPNVGVDFVFFDGEEYVFDTNPARPDVYFIGSEYFAKDYITNKDKRKMSYEGAMLFDLCHHEKANIRVEMHSWEQNPAFVQQIYTIAKQVDAKSFIFERGEAVMDDHLALMNVRIPTVDVIDFGYVNWHKLTDTPDKISGKQAAEVAKVSMTWIQSIK